MKTSVYSWRLSDELKSDLEHHARIRRVPVSSVLETAVRDWLAREQSETAPDEIQARIRAAAAKCIGAIAGGDPHRAENARAIIKERLRSRRAR
jgi:predicted transcriptional regulator